jgi:ferredoxin
MKKRIKIEDISKPSPQLSHVDKADLKPLPAPLDRAESLPDLPLLSDAARAKYECSLDDTIALSLPKPKDKQEEDALVAKFLSGLEKLFTKENNWTFLQPLLLSMEHCAACHTCSNACHIYEASGQNPIYRPAYRSEVFRRLYKKHVKAKSKGGLLQAWRDGEIELNWTTVARLAELAYRCNLCRRCAQTCPIGVDNGLIAHEIRKLFSQEMGIAAKEIHDNGSMLQLKVGSSTGMNAPVVKDNMQFIDEEVSEKTGLTITPPGTRPGPISC